MSKKGRAKQQQGYESLAKSKLKAALKTDVETICHKAAVVKLDSGVTALFFPPSYDYAKIQRDVAYPIKSQGLSAPGEGVDPQGIIELPARTGNLYGVSVDPEKEAVQSIIWEYHDGGELVHPHVNDLDPVSRDEAAQQLRTLFQRASFIA